MKFENRTILITGGTSGIGLEFARQAKSRGNTVIITGRYEARLAAASEAVPGIHALKSDVSHAADIATLYEKVVSQFPNLDTLVNNAGVMRSIDFASNNPQSDLIGEIETNFTGLVLMVNQFLPQLRTQKSAMIINVSSGLAFVPLAATPVYSATKAAVHAFTQCLRAQLKASGITIVELAPPAVATPLLHGEIAKVMAGQHGMDPALLVRNAIKGLEAGKLEIRPGSANVLKIMARVAPNFIFNQLAKMGKSKS